MLKTSKKQLSVPLTYLTNVAFETGIFPDILKTANVIPIFEKGDQQNKTTLDQSLSNQKYR